MSFNEYDLCGVDDSVIRQEKSKARDMRKSRWWQQKISAGKCHYCEAATPVKQLTMDHVVPLARGGRSSKGNIVPCCKACNTKKKNMLPIEWEEYMESLGDL